MPFKKMLKKKVKTITSSVNHYSDEAVDANVELGRKLDEVVDKFDAKTSQSQETGSAGTTGSMRVIRDGELYYLELKTADGWVRSDSSSSSGFSIRNKSV